MSLDPAIYSKVLRDYWRKIKQEYRERKRIKEGAKFKCEICGRHFKTAFGLSIHKAMVHKEGKN